MTDLLLEACCWLLCVRVCVVLLEDSSVQPWFHLIQFPSNPVSFPSCPVSFFHPDNSIFYFFPSSFPSFLPSDDAAVNSVFHSCNSPSLLCTSASLLLPVSFMMWRSMMCPWPRYESLSSSPQQALLNHNSLNPFPPPSVSLLLRPRLVLIDKIYCFFHTACPCPSGLCTIVVSLFFLNFSKFVFVLVHSHLEYSPGPPLSILSINLV